MTTANNSTLFSTAFKNVEVTFAPAVGIDQIMRNLGISSRQLDAYNRNIRDVSNEFQQLQNDNISDQSSSRASSSSQLGTFGTVLKEILVDGGSEPLLVDKATFYPNLDNQSAFNVESKILDNLDETVQETPLLKTIHDYLLVILLISVMFSMGCGVTIREIWEHLRRPTAVLVCIAAQFFLVPFIGYLIMTMLDLDVLHATGLLILACCPGGVTSNIFTFLADGDLPLSITMTSVATISALLLMPLNVWLYGRNLETNNLVIPYLEMSSTLILITIPVIIGMALNYMLPKYSPCITKLGVFAGFGIICICQSLEVIIFPDIFFGVPYRLYTAVILLPAFSFMAGYIFAKLFRLNDRICRTIGIEIGIKNVGSALTIVSLSFTLQQLKKAWVFPFLYAFSSFLVIFAVTIGYKAARKYTQEQLHKGFKKAMATSPDDDQDGCRVAGLTDENQIILEDEMQVVKKRLLNQSYDQGEIA